MIAFHNVENMVRNAREFVWIVSDQVLASLLPLLINALERGVEFKVILPQNVTPPTDVLEQMQNPTFEKAAVSKRFENRFLETTKVLICMSEAEVAALSFPNLAGRLDYVGFRAKNVSIHRWSKALFEYYWSMAKTENQL